MRDFKNMKRQRGRNRNGGGSLGGGGGGGKPQQNANRAFDSNGPDNVKIRGHAQHVFEKYQQLARDSFSSGDRVLAENYLQHADHYFRVLRTIQPQRPPSEILGRDTIVSGLDIDFEEEFEPQDEAAAAAEGVEGADNGQGEPRFERADTQNGYRQDNRERYDNRGDRQDNRNDRQEYRGDRQDGRERYDRQSQGQNHNQSQNQGQGQGQDRPFQDRQQDSRQGQDRSFQNRQGQTQDRQAQAQGQDRQGQDRQSQDRPSQGQDRQGDAQIQAQDRGEVRQDRYDNRRDNRRFEGRRDEREPRTPRFEDPRRDAAPEGERADPLPVVSPASVATPFPVSGEPGEGSPVLRSQDGGMSEAPAFLQAVGGEDGEARKPRARRRRAPRSFDSDASGGDPPDSTPEES